MIKIETDISETELLRGGIIHKHETEICEDADGSKRTKIEREEFRDAEGVI